MVRGGRGQRDAWCSGDEVSKDGREDIDGVRRWSRQWTGWGRVHLGVNGPARVVMLEVPSVCRGSVLQQGDSAPIVLSKVSSRDGDAVVMMISNDDALQTDRQTYSRCVRLASLIVGSNFFFVPKWNLLDWSQQIAIVGTGRRDQEARPRKRGGATVKHPTLTPASSQPRL